MSADGSAASQSKKSRSKTPGHGESGGGTSNAD